MTRPTVSRSAVPAEPERRKAKPAKPATPEPSGSPHSMRRHRGVYIWRPTMDQAPDSDELQAMPDVHTAETEIAKLSKKPRRELH